MFIINRLARNTRIYPTPYPYAGSGSTRLSANAGKKKARVEARVRLLRLVVRGGAERPTRAPFSYYRSAPPEVHARRIPLRLRPREVGSGSRPCENVRKPRKRRIGFSICLPRIAVASTFGFQIDQIEKNFLRAN
jgi:hypothetical protein